MSQQHNSSSSLAALRQIQNSSSSASPPDATNPGQHDTRAEAPLPPQASFVVDVVVNLLAGRVDAAAILATVASRLAPPAEPLQASPLQQPDLQPAPETVAVRPVACSMLHVARAQQCSALVQAPGQAAVLAVARERDSEARGASLCGMLVCCQRLAL